MSQYLIVPIKMDALYLAKERYLTAASVDFTRLPYTDPVNGWDVNPETPYLSEAISSKPFQDQTLRTRAGIHLHWALPDALTRADHKDSMTVFPTVPNRWLLSRSVQINGNRLIEAQWVVESDYLSELDTGSISYPYIPEQMETKSAYPFQFLGRKLAISAWNKAEGSYLKELTAVGYGDALFAAFYPNCHSVFGLHDEHYTDSLPQGLAYELIGWYSDESQDELSKWLKTMDASENWVEALESQFNWTSQDDSAWPERMICYAQLNFEPEDELENPLLGEAGETGVYIGTSATEALAAHLGKVIPNTNEDELENLLESLSFADELEAQALDTGAKFREERHSRTFMNVQSGILWQIGRVDDTTEGADAVKTQNRNQLDLPTSLSQQLDKLNSAQQAFDKASHEIDSQREQLFADWYKYMLAAYPPETSREDYPDVDEVRFFIEKNIERLNRQLDKNGQYPIEYQAVEAALQEISVSLEALNRQADVQELGIVFSLQATVAPYYYQSNEPVVLFTGNAATPTDRHGQDGASDADGLLQCYLVNSLIENAFDTAQSLVNLQTEISTFINNLENPNTAIQIWKYQPWHPIFLQWEVEYFPNGFTQNSSLDDFPPDYISANYVLPEEDVELRLRDNAFMPERGANVYLGTSILSSAAEESLKSRILNYLEKHILLPYYEGNNIESDERHPDDFKTRQAEIFAWYKANGDNETFITLIDVYEHLENHESKNLSQSLGGFNDALVMQKLTRQTPIDDPIGFSDYRNFSQQTVQNAVGTKMIHAPQPQAGFNPIRAGALRILRLRLVDNFGIAYDVDVSQITTTTQLRLQGWENWVALPPRLAQAARLDFRWLSANTNRSETNSQIDSSPICGWILPNNLDDSLAVYDSKGKALGSLYGLADPKSPELAQWRPEPGLETASQIGDIANPHLRKVVQQMQVNGANHIANLLEIIDTALALIDPENPSPARSQALLMARPIAVVRARISLELMGLPAVNQDWNIFRQDMKRNTRESNEFTHVRFPIRIGEHLQLNDGLIGYYEEDMAHQLQNMFYAIQSEISNDSYIKTYSDEPINIYQAVSSPPYYLTMLVDPRGTIHATSGILPTKSISIPSEQYQDALKNIEISFFASPMLTDGDELDLPLVHEAAYLWSWLERVGQEWQETNSLQVIKKEAFDDTFADDSDAIWQGLIAEGWLSPSDEETALIVAEDLRPALSGDLLEIQAEIEAVLEQSNIDTAKNTARFMVKPTMREGWLKLRKLAERNSGDA